MTDITPTRRVNERSLYERLGAETVGRLVAAFYARVDGDPVLRPFYGNTLSCAITGLTDFMTPWLGGPAVYDLPAARLRRRHLPFAIDARARDAWLATMTAAVHEVGIPEAEADLLLAHFEHGADAIVNTGKPAEKTPRPPVCFDSRLSEQWTRTAEAETLLDAVTNGDLAAVRSMLPMRLVPHTVLMSHALTDWLDPTGRKDRRFGRRPKQVNPLDVIECLLAQRALDPEPGNDLERFRHLQAIIEAYAGVSSLAPPDWPSYTALRTATHDRFIAEVERDSSCVRLVGLRGQTLLHEVSSAGDAELATVLIRSGADPDATESEGHRPLYRASTGEVARVLLTVGATADATSGPTQGTALHQAARHGSTGVAEALLDHGATIDMPDAKGHTPLRRAVNCRQVEVVRLLVQRGADRNRADRRGISPANVACTDEMKQALVGAA
jgi:hemoglobin